MAEYAARYEVQFETTTKNYHWRGWVTAEDGRAISPEFSGCSLRKGERGRKQCVKYAAKKLRKEIAAYQERDRAGVLRGTLANPARLQGPSA